MPLGLSSMVLASTLALSPFSTPSMLRAAEGAWPAGGGGTPAPKTETKPATETPPSSEPAADPSWDEPDPADATTPAPTEPAPGDPSDALAPAPTTAPPPVLPVPSATPQGIVVKPTVQSGIGLMIAAGATGGLGWVIALSKLSALNRCKSAIGTAVVDGGSSAFGAFGQCLKSTGSMVGLTIPGWIVNDVTYGLAPAAGVYRGRYDGTNAAWDGKPQRPAPVFIGVGAGLLAGGVVGRILTMVAFWRQLNPERLFQKYPLGAHFVLQQVAAASIQAGGGMLGYGLAFKRAKTTEDSRRKAGGLADVKLAPQLGFAYTGLALTGQF